MTNSEFQEFQQFLKADIRPPTEVDVKVRETIERSLNPSTPITISKLFGLNAIGSASTLLLCPQFGVSVFGNHGLMSLLMDLGPVICFTVCGAIWIAGGQLLAQKILTFDERRVASKNIWAVGFGFIVFSVLTFACLGKLTFDIWLVAWISGAIAAVMLFGLASLRKFRRYQILMSKS